MKSSAIDQESRMKYLATASRGTHVSILQEQTLLK